MKIQWKQLIIRLLVPLLGGALVALYTNGSMQGVYNTIDRPPFSPPPWVFPVVWTVLYLLMGYASYLVAEKGGEGAEKALFFYHVQLLLNFLWPVLFFKFELFFAAAVEIVLLLIFLAVTTVLFWKVRPAAGALMLPYLAWTVFASYLCIATAVLN